MRSSTSRGCTARGRNFCRPTGELAEQRPAWNVSLALLAALLSGSGCASTLPPAPPASAPPPAAPERAGRASKLRPKLRVAPLEIVFCGPRGQARADEALSIKNITQDAIQIRDVAIVGTDAATFALAEVPPLPRYLPADRAIDMRVVFRPPAEARPGVHRAILLVHLGSDNESAPPVDLSALVTTGEPGVEPSLHEIVQALGYDIDVGGTGRVLGTDPAPRGDEVSAGLFRAIKEGQLALDPVARFSTATALPYGYYRPGQTATEPKHLGTLADDATATLNPVFLDGDGQVTFDPGPQPFGIFLTQPGRTTFSENTRNGIGVPPPSLRQSHKKAPAPQVPRRVPHAVRVYPLKSRNGAPIANAYLLAFEEDDDGDYQDVVFVLWNVEAIANDVGADPSAATEP